jgi:DNA-binding SARP family transcriptional activator
MKSVTRLVPLFEAVLSLGAVVVLVRIRPEWPRLPGSLSQPLTTVTVERFVLVALWLSTALLLCLLFVHSIAALAARSTRPRRLPPSREQGRVSSRRSRTRVHFAGVTAGQAFPPPFPPPFPLILRRHSELTPLHNERPEQVPATDAKPVRPGVRIAILGPLEICVDGKRARGLRSLTLQLIVYLSLHRRGAIADDLAEVLLPGIAAERARRRISRALSEARAELGDVIVRVGNAYALDPTAVAIDVDEFDLLIGRAKIESGSTRERLFERALALVRGEPFAGTDYPWAAGEERHLKAEVVDVLRQLGEFRLASGDPAEALATAERALRFDEANESAQRLAMRAESALGLREAVVKRYERLARRLDRQFGLEPEHETRALYRQVLSQDGGSIKAANRGRVFS